jgi:hypothetical protein
MQSETFDLIESTFRQQGVALAIDRLVAAIEQDKDHHRLFDALCLRAKHGLGLPLTRPTSFDDVPEGMRDEFEKAYVAAARRAGEAFLAEGNISQAYMYLRTIREPGKVADAIEKLPTDGPIDEQVLEIALFQGVAPAKGVAMMLAGHGTCSTITALDQKLGELPESARRQCVALMVRKLYRDLRENVEVEVRKRQPMLPQGQSLRELIAGRDWLFSNDNYHIDVSHLNSVVRMARSLSPGDVELADAIQLAQYGSKLAPQYQYGGSPPFDEFYPAHQHFLRVLAGERVDDGLGWFRDKLASAADDASTKLAALTLIDLLQRTGRGDEAVELAVTHLSEGADQFGFSLADFCLQAGRLDKYRELARAEGDLVAFTAALGSETAPRLVSGGG